jgi:branched-chain amino acid transport system substrate-binding protein
LRAVALSRGKRWVLLLALLAGLAALLWSGGRAVRGRPIRIAFAGPTSGPSAEDGLSAVRAIELVFDRINAAGGVANRPLELDVYDDGNDPERAREIAPTIVAESDTIAVIGHNFSTCSIAAGEVYAARGIPAVASAATSVAVTRDNEWYFRTIYNDRAQGRFIAAYVRHVLGAERFGIAHEKEEYGAYLAQVMGRAAREVGLEHAGSWSFDAEDPDLEARLDEIASDASRSDAPEVLVLAMQPEAGVKLVKRLRNRDFAGRMVVTDALASQAFADGFQSFSKERARPGFYTEGIFASTPFLFDAGDRRAGTFLRDYVARYDRSPDWYAAFAADAASVLVEALRRAGLDPSPDSVAADRARLRESLASIGRLDAVAGITGPTWFDATGDAQKPVPMGRFLNGEIVSAFAQLRLLPGVTRPEDLDETLSPGRLVKLGDRFLYRTDVARVGVRARRIDKIDLATSTFELDFDLWFRHQGDHGVEDVTFTNAVEPISLGTPVDEVSDGPLRYRLYRGQGVFRMDAIQADYGDHALVLSLHHRDRTRDDLVYAIDPVGMNLGRGRTRADRGARARSLLGATSDWTVSDLIFFEAEVGEPGLGHPRYLAGTTPARRFSQLTLGVNVHRQSFSLRGVAPEALQPALLAAGLAGSLALLLASPAGFTKLRWLLQAAFAVLLLVSAEPLLGNWLRATYGSYSVEKMTRTFDVLWWVLPALLAIAAIDRFVWTPAEERTGHPVPTLLRTFVGFLVLLLAFFGVVAFVYDYRLTGLLATSGVLAMILGLAVQLNITNIFAGVALNLERPFRVGDWIMIHGRTPEPDQSIIGMVTDINWRTTRLRTADDTEIVIPNGIISEKTITNFMSPNEMSRFELFFSVDQAVPSERVVTEIQAAVDSVTGSENRGPLADPPPKTRIHGASQGIVDYVVRYRLIPSQVSPHQARHTINEAVLRRLREAGIELAYPKRHVLEERAGDAEA